MEINDQSKKVISVNLKVLKFLQLKAKAWWVHKIVFFTFLTTVVPWWQEGMFLEYHKDFLPFPWNNEQKLQIISRRKLNKSYLKLQKRFIYIRHQNVKISQPYWDFLFNKNNNVPSFCNYLLCFQKP